MAFTKVVGPGIHTLAQLRTHNIHSAGIITATRFVGEIGAGTGNTSTFTNVNITGNLTVQGDTTTLNTTLRNVELLRVASNSTTTAGIITQTGTGDILNLFDGSTEVMTVVDGGNVGIGLTNPTKLLELKGTDPTIKLWDSSGDAYALIEGDSADQGSIRFRADPLGGGGSTHIRFDVDGSERLRINSAGVSTFHGDITLEAAGANRISMRHTSGGNAVIKNPTAASLSFGTNNQDNELTIANGGKVGINTTVPATKLHIFDSSADPYLRIGGGGRDCGIQLDANTNFTAFRTDAANRLYVNAGGDTIRFSIGGTGSEKVRITSGGAVGINETSPTGKLTITQDPQGFPSDSAQPNATILIKHGTSGSSRRWVGIGASLTGAWLQSSSPGGTGLAAPFWINKGGGDVSIGSGGTKLFIKHATQPSIGIGNNTPVGNLDIRDTKANLIVAKTGLTVKGNSDLSTTYDMIQLGAGGALASYSTATATADTELIHNAYRHSGNNWKYRYQDTACKLLMNTPGGTFVFQRAASGNADADISFSESLRIDSNGRLLLGTDVAPSSTNTLLRVHTPISSSSVNSIEITHNTNGADKAGAALGLAIGNGGASTNAADLYFSTATNGSLEQRLWIKENGDMGLGASNPGADPAIGNDATVFEIRQTTSGNITSGNNRKGAVLRLKHEAQWENGYQSSSPNDDLGRVEFVTGDNSTGEGVRSVIRCRNLQYFNDQALTFEVATANSTSLEERLRINSSGDVCIGGSSSDIGNKLNVVESSGNAAILLAASTVSASGFADFTFAPSNKVAGGRIRVQAEEDFSSTATRTANMQFYTRKDGTFTERLRITSEGELLLGDSFSTNINTFKMGIKESANENAAILFVDTDNMRGGICGIAKGNNELISGTSNVDFVLGSLYNDTHIIYGGSGDQNGRLGMTIKGATGKVEIGSGGNYGSSPVMLNVGSRSQNIAGSIAIARGEALGGGTGPTLELVHGPDGGTQRTHGIYSYIGDLRVYADAAQDLHLRGLNTKVYDANGDSRMEVQSDGDFKVANPGWSTTSSPSSNCFQGLSQLGSQHWGHRQYYSKQFNLTQNQTQDLISNNTAHDDIIFWLNVKGYHANRTFATVHGTIGGYGITYHSQHGASGKGFSLSAHNIASGRNALRFTSSSSYGANWWVWGWISGTSGTGTHTGMTAKQLNS